MTGKAIKNNILACLVAGFGLILNEVGSMAATPSELQGTWILAKIDGSTLVPTDASVLPYFTLSGNNFSGYDGCNRFAGKLDEPANTVGGQRECANPGPHLPLDMSSPRLHLAKGKVNGRSLQLPAQGQLPSSEFRKK